MKQPNGNTLYHYKHKKKTNIVVFYLQTIASYISYALEAFFFRLGCLIGKYPLITLVANLLFIGASASGLVFFYEETQPGNLWVPANSLALIHRRWVEENYPSDFLRFENALLKADNVLNPDVIKAIFSIDQKVKEITLENGLNWNGICAKLGSNCWSNSILEFWSFNESTINNLNSTDVIETINSINYSPVTGTVIDINQYLGDIRRANNGFIVSAKIASVQYVLKSNDSLQNEDKEGNINSRLWEEKFMKIMETGHPDISNLYYSAQRSRRDVGTGAVFGDLNLLFLGFAIILVFVSLSLGQFNFIHQKIFLSISGLLCIGFSILISIGICSYANVFFGPLHNILPFLLLGIGVDDMFVIIQAQELQRREMQNKPLYERTGHMLKSAGVSITVTSVTDIAAFGIGATTRIPALSSFCVYASVGVIGVYLLTVTFFVACITLDNLRADKRRNACLCCYVHKDDYIPNKCSEVQFVQTFFDVYYGKILTKWPVKALVLCLTAGFLAMGIYGVVSLEQDFSPDWFIPDDTYLKAFLNAVSKYFPNDGRVGYVYIGNVDYPGNFSNLLQIHNSLVSMEGINSGAVDSWYFSFFQWLQTLQNPVILNKTSFINSVRMPASDEEFYGLLLLYMFGNAQLGISGEGSRFIRDIVFNDSSTDLTAPRHINISKAFYKHTQFENVKAEVAAMKELRNIVANSGVPDMYAYAVIYPAWEGNDVIQDELYRNLGLAFLCVMVITLFLIAQPWTCLLVSTCIIATVVDVAGSLYWWGLTINTVTSIGTILAVGLAVDYAAHIGHTFMTVQGTRNERMSKTMSKMGPPVLYGGLSTFLAFILLAGSTSYVFRVFFRVFFGVVVFGLFHGMVYLPVILSLVGPQPYVKIAKDRERSQEKNVDELTLPHDPYHLGKQQVYTVDKAHELSGSILGTDEAFNELPGDVYAKVNKDVKEKSKKTEKILWHWKNDEVSRLNKLHALPRNGRLDGDVTAGYHPYWSQVWTYSSRQRRLPTAVNKYQNRPTSQQYVNSFSTNVKDSSPDLCRTRPKGRIFQKFVTTNKQKSVYNNVNNLHRPFRRMNDYGVSPLNFEQIYQRDGVHPYKW